MKRKLLMLASASLVAGSAANAALLVHYTFDGSDATNSGTLADGTSSVGSSYVASGLGAGAGNAWQGNRTGDNDAFINTGATGDDLGFGAAGVYTAMAWINWSGTSVGSGDHMVFGQDDGGGNNAQLHHGIRDDSVANIHFGGWGGAQDIADAGTVSTGTWTHVAWQYDGTNKNVFVDGVLSASSEAGNNITNASFDVIVGAHGRDSNLDPGPGNSFNGQLDEVRIYDEALDASQILAARNSVIPEPSTLGLLGLAALGLIRRRR
jgi:hypothetical protein